MSAKKKTKHGLSQSQTKAANGSVAVDGSTKKSKKTSNGKSINANSKRKPKTVAHAATQMNIKYDGNKKNKKKVAGTKSASTKSNVNKKKTATKSRDRSKTTEAQTEKVETNTTNKNKASQRKNAKKKATDSSRERAKTPSRSKTPSKSKKKNSDKSNNNKSNNLANKRNKKPSAKELSSPASSATSADTDTDTDVSNTETGSGPVKKRFPWDNWKIGGDNDDGAQQSSNNSLHHTRRSSLGSVRELHLAQAQKPRLQVTASVKKKSKKKKKKTGEDKWASVSIEEKVDIYDPEALKKKRKKEKEKTKFKVVPKHHVKRSSLPTYQTVRKNNPALRFLVNKETSRNLATLHDQPEKRAKSKVLRNLSRKGFDLHINRRYQLEDGRIGVCKFKGRTQFGKSSEDWIGLVLDVGVGEHDGTVQGKSYFRCRDGKGIFVRPYDVVDDLGSHTKTLSPDKVKKAQKQIEAYKKGGAQVTTSTAVVADDEEAILKDFGSSMDGEKLYNPKSLLNKNKGKKAKKKKHHTKV